MALQFSVTVRNAMLDAAESTIGTAPTLTIRSGAAPADCSAADSGTVLATVALPSDWMAAASGGSKAMLGVWQDLAADATGNAGHFRIKQGASCHMQGTVSRRAADGGTGDLQLDQANESMVTGQQFTVSSFTLTQGGA